MALGIDSFILSGYPHLEEAYRFAELVMPLLPLQHARASDGARRQYGPVRRDDRQRRPTLRAARRSVVAPSSRRSGRRPLRCRPIRFDRAKAQRIQAKRHYLQYINSRFS